MANKLNISPVISPSILATISASTAIKTFGDQTKDKNKEKIIVGNQTKTAELDKELEALTLKEQQAGQTQKTTVEKAQSDFNTNQITQDQYNDIVTNAQFVYDAEIIAINLQREKIRQDKENINNNPYDKIKKQNTATKKANQSLKKKTQNTKNKSKGDLAKQIASNVSKTLAPIIALQITNQFSNIISQRKKLEVLVDQVNDYIDIQVKDTQSAAIATNLRNNAVTLINNNIKKLESLQNTLKTISVTITIFSVIVSVLSALPIPTAVPPGVGIPVSLIVKIVKTIEKANKLISALGAILAIASVLLGNEISKLNELRERLKQISFKLDGKSLDSLSSLSNIFLPVGNEYPPYKNFNFKIKEEQDLRFVVKGNKRKYAVAINRRGVEQIKSDYSFTLDPNDLIEQLKLIIDQQNLQG